MTGPDFPQDAQSGQRRSEDPRHPSYGPQGPQGYYPGAAALGPPPKKKRGPLFWGLLAVVAVFLLIIVSCSVALGTAAGRAESSSATSASPTATAATTNAASAATTVAASTTAPTTTASPASLSLTESCNQVIPHLTDAVDIVTKVFDNPKKLTVTAEHVKATEASLYDDQGKAPAALHGDLVKINVFMEKVSSVIDAGSGNLSSPEFKTPASDLVDKCGGDAPANAAHKPKTNKPKTDKPVEKPKPKHHLSAEQEEAVGSAEDYLSEEGFSKKGLISQLSSSYGDDFDKKDAVAAVNSLDVNWNKQAVRSAKAYLETEHFSHNGLIEQLESSYGDNYTHSQAVYGANHAR